MPPAASAAIKVDFMVTFPYFGLLHHDRPERTEGCQKVTTRWKYFRMDPQAFMTMGILKVRPPAQMGRLNRGTAVHQELSW